MNKENKTPKLKGLKCDTIFKIPVSGGFHSRVIEVLTFITKDMLPKDYEEVIDKVKNKKPLNEKEKCIETLVALIYTIEDEAEKQNLTIELKEGDI